MQKPGAGLRLSLGSVLLSGLLYFTVPPANANADVGWFDRWDKRVKITINGTNINATLTNFPVLIHLSTNSGENAEDVSFIFDHLETDANQKKIAVTTSDGTNQCYVEIEDWIHTNEQAWLWVKVPNVASNADTDLYIYYDNSQPDNTNYVGDPNSTPAESVWDSNFVLVQHMKDETTSNTLDSTSNNNDGTKKGAGEPAVTANGKIDDAQSFDGIDDCVRASDSSSLDISGSYTLEAWIYAAATNISYQGIIAKRDGANVWNYQLILYYDEIYLNILMGSNSHITTNANFATNTWYHCVCVFDDVNDLTKIYVDGIEKLSEAETNSPTLDNNPVRLGSLGYAPGSYFFGGIIDEPRISDIVRNSAWIKASYETQRDSLLDFGKEKSRPIPGTVFSIK